MKGLTGSESRSLAGLASVWLVGLPLAANLADGFAALSSLFVGCRSVAMHGKTRSPTNTCGAPEYIVVANRMAQQFKRKSVTAAGKLYGLKKFCRDCNRDHRSAAPCYH